MVMKEEESNHQFHSFFIPFELLLDNNKTIQFERKNNNKMKSIFSNDNIHSFNNISILFGKKMLETL